MSGGLRRNRRGSVTCCEYAEELLVVERARCWFQRKRSRGRGGWDLLNAVPIFYETRVEGDGMLCSHRRLDVK